MGLTRVVRFISNLRGGSQPVLVAASDGFMYVLKYSNSPQGTDVPFCESMGTALYQAYGLATPEWKPLLLTDAFLDSNPDCWMLGSDGPVRPQAGLCFGSRYLGTPDVRLFEVLSGGSYARVRNRLCFWLAWAIDVCAMHSDNRQAVFVAQPSGYLQAVFIDHGQLFRHSARKIAAKMMACRYLDARIYPNLSISDMQQLRERANVVNTDKLWQAAQSLPEEWKTPTALYDFSRCLHVLATHGSLSKMLDKIWESSRPSTARSHPLISAIVRSRSLAATGI